MKDKKSGGKAMGMGQSSMDANMPAQKNLFGKSMSTYSGNVKGTFPMKKTSVTAPTLGKAKGSKSSVSGHTAKGLVKRSAPPAAIKKKSGR